MPLLSVENVTRRFGGVVALDDVSVVAEAGEIVGVIGPNGAGKTTLFDVITRLRRPQGGDVVFDGLSLLRTPPYRVAHRGIARTFQSVALFGSMTVLDNVRVGAHTRRRARRRAHEVIDYLELGPIAHRPAGSLAFGVRKRVELARALASEPRLLLLDEPAGGLAHDEVAELRSFLRRLRHDFELTIVLVEHHMGLVMDVSDRIHVLSFGRKIAEGTPEEVQRDPAVIEAYLGETP